MSTFGFNTAITSLGNFGTGFSNLFESSEAICTMEELCEKIDTLQTCCEAILGAISVNSGNIMGLKKDNKQTKIDLRLLISATERMKKGRL